MRWTDGQGSDGERKWQVQKSGGGAGWGRDTSFE